MSAAWHEFAWFMIGAAFGANLIAGIVVWHHRPRRRRPEHVIVKTDGILVTARKPLTDREAAEFRRIWLAEYGHGQQHPTVLHDDEDAP